MLRRVGPVASCVSPCKCEGRGIKLESGGRGRRRGRTKNKTRKKKKEEGNTEDAAKVINDPDSFSFCLLAREGEASKRVGWGEK